MNNKLRTDAVLKARSWLDKNPVFLDTETTGLGKYAVVCEVAVLDKNGDILLNELVNPQTSIAAQVSAIHGITDDDVKDAPSFQDILPTLAKVTSGALIVAYNAVFDWRMLNQSAHAFNLVFNEDMKMWRCAMELYTDYYGQWSDKRKIFCAQKLSNAAKQCEIKVPANLHRACADTELTRRVVLHMAESAVRSQESFPF